MRDIVEEDIVCCDSCSFRIVAGDECDKGMEILCADCFKEEKANDKWADDMMKARILRSIQGVAP